MLITQQTPPLPGKLPPPELHWQTGDYARHQDIRFIIPYPFLLLCKLWDTTPDELLSDFMDNISCGSWKREGREEAKTHLQNYIIAMKYGQQHYTHKEIIQQFTELDAVGISWPEEGSNKMINLYCRWRNKHYNYWFKKWYGKNNRQL